MEDNWKLPSYSVELFANHLNISGSCFFGLEKHEIGRTENSFGQLCHPNQEIQDRDSTPGGSFEISRLFRKARAGKDCYTG